MKKTSYFYIIIFCIAAIISIIYYSVFVGFNKGNKRENPKSTEYAPFDTAENAHIESGAEKPAAANDNNSAFVTDSAVSGYMLKASDSHVNLYEIYENGHREKIKTLDINPKLLRRIDRNDLENGIERNTYDEICSLIEDFSS